MQTNIIDVSTHQGQIDWAKVEADAVMIRACFGWDNNNQIDKQFAANVAGAVKYGTPYGLYHYSYATNASDARKEANFFLRVIEGLKPQYPVAFDFEDVTQLGGYDSNGRYHKSLPLGTQLDIIDAFLSTVEAAGYFAMLYMSASPLMQLYRYAPKRIKRYSIWVAHYGADKPNFAGEYGIWQYGVVGRWGTKGRDYTIPGQVSGVNANCDVNYGYKDYPAIIKAAGLNGFSKTTQPPKPVETQADELARIRAELTASKEHTVKLKKQVNSLTDELASYKNKCLEAAKLLTE
ncbi:GH25 family lysozyme M1 (1,4-beta-N-acetylmuramidase) [Hydrogenoanaerobacterium saccharovorans]|uniref:Lyzozyme M1 (1,4-beta-N-acetylmuramidase), GH25 family n=1 Tax=Hydrogenoanaerobacterium saccharovorans TaxID=474960 RepID=A0A1H7ZZF4_9FIRM|nr:glycoside hydrolase family 25 protein [Hydrogenoanaerobacterium saccharovorans]RPF48276.1 GH25 family lysozyme M1 (1,4-beta-N-acetylmuramidase) [Hydrogenoanaerobacterium saccharovorans]SEM63653.1 Lyzozyme M1 (1,4-beta-N-acetylmuramidase), GH25 family [Hydrogenoanaerobacterium saccharovorans]